MSLENLTTQLESSNLLKAASTLFEEAEKFPVRVEHRDDIWTCRRLHGTKPATTSLRFSLLFVLIHREEEVAITVSILYSKISRHRNFVITFDILSEKKKKYCVTGTVLAFL